ncbi:hypothetical protein WJX84_009266 [Apatococcus fuscideae]|uniref:Misato Segment II tubulin-like domain-containing protein n=1 Tax=Apatococcus fuscideae TaxID=2026836 RepID=A0AAW1T7N7_9CHLO
MHEIVTVQFGDFANYTGSHFWNLQDECAGAGHEHGTAGEVDENILHQEACDSRGLVSWTPRLLILAARDSFAGGSLTGAPQACADSQAEAHGQAWSGRTQLHQAEQVKRSHFNELLDEDTDTADARDLESSGVSTAAQASRDSLLEEAAGRLNHPRAVKFWTDFTQVLLHPRAVVPLPGIWHGASTFEGFTQGSDILTREDREDFLDRARSLAEACDSPQGLQLLVEDLGGFGGLVADILSELRDSTATDTVLLFALRGSSHGPARSTLQGSAQTAWQLNEALSLAYLSSEASVMTPMAAPRDAASLPGLHWDPDQAFHTSALCAAALDSITHPFRTAPSPASPSAGPMTMAELMQLLIVGPAANLAAVCGLMPVPDLQIDSQSQEMDTRSSNICHSRAQAPPMASWTPGLRPACHDVLSESAVLRGPACGGLPASSKSAEDFLQTMSSDDGSRCPRQSFISTVGVNIPLPFPGIFNSRLLSTSDGAPGFANALAAGDLSALSGGSRPQCCSKMSYSMVTRWCASRAFMPYISEITMRMPGMSGGYLGRSILRSWNCGEDVVLESQEKLYELADAYRRISTDPYSSAQLPANASVSTSALAFRPTTARVAQGCPWQ